MKVKVCGMRDPQSIREIGALRPDYMGFVFYPPSPRFAGRLDPDALAALPASIRRTGVFVDASREEVEAAVVRYGLAAVQLHGRETPELCARLRERCEVIKAFGIAGAEDLRAVRKYEEVCDLLLFDTRTPAHGGSGRRFDWETLRAYDGRLPFLLSGGIGPEDAGRVRNFSHPRYAGVDLNSRFETSPGCKDAEAVKNFIKSIR